MRKGACGTFQLACATGIADIASSTSGMTRRNDQSVCFTGRNAITYDDTAREPTMRSTSPVFVALTLLIAAPLFAQTFEVSAHDFLVRDFRFQNGSTLPEVRIRYRTIGAPRKDGQGRISNAVLVLHGSSGDASQVLAPSFT